MPLSDKDQFIVGSVVFGNPSTGPRAESLAFTRRKLAQGEFSAAWKDVKAEEFTKDDWLDLHATIQGFKERVVQRHRPVTTARREGEQ